VRSVPAGGVERMHEINGPASSTPTTDGERVYVYFGSFGLIAYELDGEEAWRREMPLPQNSFGTAASPIVVEDLLILLRDVNGESFLEAIDGESGDVLWHMEREGFGSGWSTPSLWRREGTDELLVLGVWWLTAYDLADGSERWSVPGLTDEPIVTPTVGDGLVYVSSYNMNRGTEVIGLPEFEELLVEHDHDGDGELNRDEAAENASVLSRFDADGEGDHPLRIFFRFLDEDQDGSITAAEYPKLASWLGAFEHANAVVAVRPGADGKPAEIAWQQARGVPECPSPLYYEGRLYLIKNGGMMSCLDAGTGEIVYQDRTGARGPCYASPVAGDGKIYTASARGEVTVVKAGDELEVLARNDLGERIMATPALVDGAVYVRTEKHLFAFGLSE
jgi:outer membrane protein assembly factor BamB